MNIIEDLSWNRTKVFNETTQRVCHERYRRFIMKPYKGF